jgi:hypothetical protein
MKPQITQITQIFLFFLRVPLCKKVTGAGGGIKEEFPITISEITKKKPKAVMVCITVLLSCKI